MMKMNKIIFTVIAIIITVFVYSCSTPHGHLPLMSIYETVDAPGIPNTIILKRNGNTYEEYSSTIGLNTVGTYEVNGDTIIFNYSFEYVRTRGGMKVFSDSANIYVFLPRKYLIKDNGNMLIDITDYSPIAAEWAKDSVLKYFNQPISPANFRRMKLKR